MHTVTDHTRAVLHGVVFVGGHSYPSTGLGRTGILAEGTYSMCFVFVVHEHGLHCPLGTRAFLVFLPFCVPARSLVLPFAILSYTSLPWAYLCIGIWGSGDKSMVHFVWRRECTFRYHSLQSGYLIDHEYLIMRSWDFIIVRHHLNTYNL